VHKLLHVEQVPRVLVVVGNVPIQEQYPLATHLNFSNACGSAVLRL
jgi:hypothetical protein